MNNNVKSLMEKYVKDITNPFNPKTDFIIPPNKGLKSNINIDTLIMNNKGDDKNDYTK